jgi:hypothetical protein
MQVTELETGNSEVESTEIDYKRGKKIYIYISEYFGLLYYDGARGGSVG